VEVAFGANVAKNVELLAPVGSMAAYATNSRTPITLKNSTETREPIRRSGCPAPTRVNPDLSDSYAAICVYGAGALRTAPSKRLCFADAM
jgi:hypothetical protein